MADSGHGSNGTASCVENSGVTGDSIAGGGPVLAGAAGAASIVGKGNQRTDYVAVSNT